MIVGYTCAVVAVIGFAIGQYGCWREAQVIHRQIERLRKP